MSKNNEIIQELKEHLQLDPVNDSLNIEGEVGAVTEAITWAVTKGYTEITIGYDYDGIEKWAIGESSINQLCDSN